MAKKQKKISIPFMGMDGLTINNKDIFYDDLGDDNFPKYEKMKVKKVLKVRDKNIKKKKRDE